jgi:hypothetical protein
VVVIVLPSWLSMSLLTMHASLACIRGHWVLYLRLVGVVFAVGGCCICGWWVLYTAVGLSSRSLGCIALPRLSSRSLGYSRSLDCIRGCWAVFAVAGLYSPSLGVVFGAAGLYSPSLCWIHCRWVVFALLGLGLPSLCCGFLDIIESISISSNPDRCR